MRLQDTSATGPAPVDGPTQGPEKNFKIFSTTSATLPFGQPIPLQDLTGPTYLTAQTLVQQVAFSLSDRLWTYSPDTFDLDTAVKKWAEEKDINALGRPTKVESLQIRAGAAAIALGYIFSKDFDLERRRVPQAVLASSSTLKYLRSSLEQLSLLYSVASPFVAHISAADYVGGASASLVTDYCSTLSLADDLGFAVVSSFSAHEVQHTALLATLISDVVPTFHTFDGVRVGRETTRIIDVMDQSALLRAYKAIQADFQTKSRKSASLDTKVETMLSAFNEELGTEYGLFDYRGHGSPDAVLVAFGTIESSLASQVALNLERDGAKIGVVNVRVYRPFVEEAFLNVLPKSVKKIGVLGQVMDRAAVSDSCIRSSLYSDVVAALAFADGFHEMPNILDIKYPREQAWKPVSMAAAYQILVEKPLLKRDGEDEVVPGSDLQLLDHSVQQFTFWDLDTSPLADTPTILASTLSKDSSHNVSTRRWHDNLVQGGARRTDIRKSQKVIDATYSVDLADVVYIGNEEILKGIDVLTTLKHEGRVMINLPGVKDDDLEKKLPAPFRRAIAEKSARLYILDTQALESGEAGDDIKAFLVQLAFLRVAVPSLEEVGIKKLATVNGDLSILQSLAAKLDSALRLLEVPKDWLELDAEPPKLPLDISLNSFANAELEETEPPTFLANWQTAAKAMAFREAYSTKNALRPDLSTTTFNVHVSENRRLTPSTYDRNIFHIEFDLGDSGLIYNIGESLGVHAENHVDDVNEFIKYYGLDPQAIVQVPSRESPVLLESRTVYQALMQNVDLWGRPPKRFYESLAEFATDPIQKKELLSLGGLEGVTEFRRRAEVDTITYADVLLEFDSAKPDFHDIIRIVAPMKRREYSIASSQKVTPKSVALMIVAVDWVDPRGRNRWGQATRYLKELQPGDSVTVSVKPSVMKLPTKTTAPIIMAGLGTGLAPFRAFVQHRAWEKEQGHEIGPVLLYMGSRHQREEYCYGEEWEAYQDAGIITLLGRAFSRDQPQKIYIQDRMRETLMDICEAYFGDKYGGGSFYLCGPTWPVPDVQNVLEEGVVRWADMTKTADAKDKKKVNGRKEIERLKDEGRYVLEVY
ncbi:hypothetical protein MMC25_006821 [Agyrium rufum]|nr:hypothetical protein [Agyrium rufum]